MYLKVGCLDAICHVFMPFSIENNYIVFLPVRICSNVYLHPLFVYGDSVVHMHDNLRNFVACIQKYIEV